MPYVLGPELSQFSYSSGADGLAEVRRVMDPLPEFVVVRQCLPGEPAPAALDAMIFSKLANYHLAFQAVDGGDNSIIRIHWK